jgi:hypothetical protein
MTYEIQGWPLDYIKPPESPAWTMSAGLAGEARKIARDMSLNRKRERVVVVRETKGERRQVDSFVRGRRG